MPLLHKHAKMQHMTRKTLKRIQGISRKALRKGTRSWEYKNSEKRETDDNRKLNKTKFGDITTQVKKVLRRQIHLLGVHCTEDRRL